MKRQPGEGNAHLEHRRFMMRTSGSYHTQKVNADKAKAKLRFTLSEFRDVVEAAIETGCPYCDVKIRAKNFSPDHIVPISRGGSYGLDNLQIICEPCNGQKGGLTDEEFTKLLALISDFDQAAQTDIRRRLRAGSKALWQMYGKASKRPEAK